MGAFRQEPTGKEEIQLRAWIQAGGWVVTASDRAARALTAAYDQAQLAAGLSAWPSAPILDWRNFVQSAWQQRTVDGRLLLNSTQEQAIWAEIAGSGSQLATVLTGPLHRLAGLAMEAHELLCAYSPRSLKIAARSTWQQDAAAFSGWLTAFDERCRNEQLLSPSRLPIELIALLQKDEKRKPLLLVGFDRLMPTQRELFTAWGDWRESDSGSIAEEVQFHGAISQQEELNACVAWCGEKLKADPATRLLVVTQQASARRGEIERGFLKLGPGAFEFSLGVPLRQTTLAKGAFLVLRWLSGQPLTEQELDWLFATGHIAATQEEATALHVHMRRLRRRGLEQPQWILDSFLAQCRDFGAPAWVERYLALDRRLLNQKKKPQDWAELVPQLLEAVHWPGFRPLDSAEFQALNRWQAAVETAGSLGFDGRRLIFSSFLSALERALGETLFAPESQNAPIQISGPAESAGLSADALWFLGADEDSWPASGPMHPLLPTDVQRSAEMPHASAQLDGVLAETITERLLASAPEVHFSYARQKENTETRPSRLIMQRIGPPQALPLAATTSLPEETILFADSSKIPFPPGQARGGSSVLTAQSQCPFKAFATARLGAQSWRPAEAGLTALQRGQLLHAVLHSVWNEIGSHADLLGLASIREFAAKHVSRVLAAEIRPEIRERMPKRYLELEVLRLNRLIAEWLEYESQRVPFTVAGTEVDETITLAGLTLKLRLDRVDRLCDGTLLVIDYKTGDVSPRSWDLPRPEDLQLPLYAGYALSQGTGNRDQGSGVANQSSVVSRQLSVVRGQDEAESNVVGGLVFAKVRAGEYAFAGRVGDAKGTLRADLGGGTALVKNALTAEQLIDWRDCIERLAEDFVAGRAEVDPRQAPKTCENCDLQSLCRIHEQQIAVSDEEDSDE
jgi:probable DNA repair protein